jgi:hypothetical protein
LLNWRRADSDLGAAGDVLSALIDELYPKAGQFDRTFLKIKVRERLCSELGLKTKRG